MTPKKENGSKMISNAYKRSKERQNLMKQKSIKDIYQTSQSISKYTPKRRLMTEIDDQKIQKNGSPKKSKENRKFNHVRRSSEHLKNNDYRILDKNQLTPNYRVDKRREFSQQNNVEDFNKNKRIKSNRDYNNKDSNTPTRPKNEKYEPKQTRIMKTPNKQMRSSNSSRFITPISKVPKRENTIFRNRNQQDKSSSLSNFNTPKIDRFAKGFSSSYNYLIASGKYQNTSNQDFLDYLNQCKKEYKKALNLRRDQSPPRRNVQLNNINHSNKNKKYLNSNFIDKKTLMIDLDETLIHSEEFVQDKQYDFIFYIPPEEGEMLAVVSFQLICHDLIK